LFKRRKPDDAPAPKPVPTDLKQAEKLAVGMPSPSPFAKPATAAPSGVGGASAISPPKEPMPMGRMPFPGSPQPPSPSPVPGGSTGPGAGPNTGMGGAMLSGAGAPPRPGTPPPRPREGEAERRTLVVGRGISVQGTVQDAERLVVEGTVEASMIRATELSIAQGGVFKGAVEVEDAEIAGTIDGTLTARSNLIVRATGKVLGTAHYRRLQVEDGGQITGELKMTADGRPEPAKVTGES